MGCFFLLSAVWLPCCVHVCLALAFPYPLLFLPLSLFLFLYHQSCIRSVSFVSQSSVAFSYFFL